MTTLKSLPEITAVLANWLSAQPLDDLPEISGVFVYGPERFLLPAETQIKIQLGSSNAALASLADWAEHLDTTVTATRARSSSNTFAAISTATEDNHGITLWNLLDTDAQIALATRRIHVLPDEPLEITLAQLRAASGHAA
ncbi:hypothetical protein AB0I53_11930 [Saccharopolyspora sp. NPDC050389]|uniref:hypothetical protein n=1 Tax=Saccharopolyspora sp. NPDC050389 TaxID=3155516 RepID=UPI0033ECA07D